MVSIDWIPIEFYSNDVTLSVLVFYFLLDICLLEGQRSMAELEIIIKLKWY